MINVENKVGFLSKIQISKLADKIIKDTDDNGPWPCRTCEDTQPTKKIGGKVMTCTVFLIDGKCRNNV
jgi:hypothetical protein